jgi:type IV pilus assembly protein PilP
MMSRTIFIPLLTLALGACANNTEDLSVWMQKQGESMRGKIDPIPELQPYEPYTFNANDVIDPFKPRKVDIGRSNSTKAPDANRRREALEAFPLEKIRMVGTMQHAKEKDLTALVRTEDNRVFQLKRGNYVGQNFGVVTSITEADINLKELFQDGSGEWTERVTRIGLLESKAMDAAKK